jgi:N-acetylneuraminic acid mutarotase
MASLVFAAAALAQMPTSPWKKGAPFPQPDEELYGVALNGKMYVIGGWDDGKAGGVNYEYNPATDKWTKKQPMPRPAHHAALAGANGKIYVMGGFVVPKDTAIPVGGAWEPIDNAWEYDPAAGSWKSLPTRPGKRGSALAGSRRQDLRYRRCDDGGWIEGSPSPSSDLPRFSARTMYDPATHKWESRTPMSVARNHASAPPSTARSTSLAAEPATASSCPPPTRDVVEEYNPVSNSWSARKSDAYAAKRRGLGTDGRRIFVAGGEVTTTGGRRRCV